VVRLEGRLDSETVPELRAFLREAGEGSLTLELSGLASIDHDGLAALVSLRNAGYALQGGTLYVNRLLKEANP
jgi:anti-anti-sigma regulatory factor